MSSFEEAAEKLRRECEAGSFDRHGQVMKQAVAEALARFCGQSEAFSQKVLKGKSFEECMKAVGKGVGDSISDLEAFRRAVQYYWKGADVRFQMEIVEAAGETGGPPRASAPTGENGAQIFDLTDFL